MYLSKLKDYIYLLLYIKKLLTSHSGIYHESSFSSKTDERLLKRNEWSFTVQKKRFRSIKESILQGTYDIPVDLDDNAVVLISPNVLCNRPLFGSWMIATFESLSRKTVRWVQLYSDSRVDEGHCFVSSALHCNIPYGASMKIKLYKY